MHFPRSRAAVIAVVGLVTIPINYFILRRLLAMVDTVRGGDPFIADNAYRLQAIAWALLALQLLSMVIGGIGALATVGFEPAIAVVRFEYATFALALVGAFFLAISLFSVFILRWLERRYGRIER